MTGGYSAKKDWFVKKSRIPKEREMLMNIVFSSDKKEYNTIKKGTEILLAENDGFNQNI